MTVNDTFPDLLEILEEKDAININGLDKPRKEFNESTNRINDFRIIVFT